ncbi:MAG: tetratricopeptide repeat-containing sensor histidine kinase [Bacteroidales bacterium]
MKLINIIPFLLLAFLSLHGQTAPNLNHYSADTTKMRVWTEYCRKVCLNENFTLLSTSAKKGIALSKGNNRFSSIFYYYEGIGYEYATRQDSLAIDCYEKSLNFAKKEGDMEQVGYIIRRLYYLYYLYKMNDRATQLINYIKSSVKSVKNSEIKANFLVCICNSYLFHDEYESFINYAFQTIDVYKNRLEKNTKNNRNIANLYRNIVGAYIQMGQFDKALEYCAIAAKYSMHEPINLAYLYSYYVKIYSNLGRIDMQMRYILKLEAIKDYYYEKQTCLAESYTALAENYLQINQLSDATKYIEKAIQAGILSKNQEVVVEATTIKGKILYAKKEYQPAIKLLRSIEKDAKMYDKWNYAEMLNVIAESYKYSGNSNQAYRYLERYTLEKDTLLKETAKKNIANAEARYQNNVKLQEIRALKAKNTIHQLQEEKSKSQIAVLLLVLLMVVGISGFIYYKSKERKKTNEKLQQLNAELDEANQIKARFFGILNHDLRSPLANLIHLLELKKENDNAIDQATITRLENQSIDSAHNLLISMEDMLLWGKGQMSNFEPQMKPIAVEELFRYIEQYFKSETKITFSFENSNNLQLISDENILKTILRNLTSNAIKALLRVEHPSIRWSARHDEDFIYLTITDNGHGVSKDHLKALYDDTEVVGVKNGLGLHLIRDLSGIVDCNIELESSSPEGTTFCLKFRKLIGS